MLKKKVNIKVLMPAFFPDFAGWIYQLDNLMNNINSKKFTFSIFTRKPAPTKNNIGADSSNFSITRVSPSNKFKGIFANLLFIYKAYYHLISNRTNIDLIYIPFLFFPGFVFIPIAKLIHVPVIGQISGEEIRHSNSIISKTRIKMICFLDLIIVLNHHDENRLKKLNFSDNKVYFIPNHIDNSKFYPVSAKDKNKLKKKFQIPAGLPVISFVGLINNRKGVHLLIQAAKKLLAENIVFFLILAGPIEESAELDPDYIKKVMLMGEHPNIRFLGKVKKINEIYQTSDIFVLPSYSEGMPGALLEALASGLTCICSDIPGSAEVINDNKNGILFRCGNIDELTVKLKYYIQNSAERKKLGAAAQATIANNFTSSIIAKKYEQIFESINPKLSSS